MSSEYYVAVRGMPLSELVDAVGFDPTEDPNSEYLAIEGLDGWSIVANTDGIGLPPHLEWDIGALSDGRAMMVYALQTTVMVNQLYLYRDGELEDILGNDDDDDDDEAPDEPDDAFGVAHRTFTEATGVTAIVWSTDAPALRTYPIVPRTKEQVLPRTRWLAVNGGDEHPTTLAAVRDAASALDGRGSLKLSVLFDGRRRTLSATFEFGELRVVALGDGRYRARAATALSPVDVTSLFEHFYEVGARAPTFTWEPL